MIPKNTPPGTPVEVEFRDDWRSGFFFIRPTGSMDCDYRVVVRGEQGEYLDGIHPACVRVSE